MGKGWVSPRHSHTCLSPVGDGVETTNLDTLETTFDKDDVELLEYNGAGDDFYNLNTNRDQHDLNLFLWFDSGQEGSLELDPIDRTTTTQQQQ